MLYTSLTQDLFFEPARNFINSNFAGDVKKWRFVRLYRVLLRLLSIGVRIRFSISASWQEKHNFSACLIIPQAHGVKIASNKKRADWKLSLSCSRLWTV